LAVHFVFEGLKPGNREYGFKLDAKEIHTHPAWKDCEDNFVLFSAGTQYDGLSFTQPAKQASARKFPPVISPMLPPPISKMLSDCQLHFTATIQVRYSNQQESMDGESNISWSNECNP
jgi:hypothetical protein